MRASLFSRAIGALMLLMMLLTMTAQAAWAQGTGTRTVSYINTDGQEQSIDATVIDNNNMPTTLDGGWYVVTEDVEYSDGIDIIGDVNLILADGANMDINSNGVGIYIFGYTNLTIYGQASGSGSINITSDEEAIYGGWYSSGCFIFTLVGGNITANSNIYFNDGGSFNLGGVSVTSSDYRVPGNIIYIADGWIYTDGTDFFDTGSISTDSGAATYRPKWWDGNGTSDDPYLIKTTADLDQLTTRVNSYFSDYSGTYFKLDNDITYTHKADNEEGADTENNYTAIGGDFGGHFDGGGHTISGIRIYQDNKDYQGLFGYIRNGEVKNVILADTRITGRVEVGGIVGENYGTVSNCLYLDGSVDGSASVGGIVGKNYRTVSNCYYTSTNITSAIGYGTDGTNVGLAYMLTLGEGITCSGNALSLGGYNVATSGQEVTLTYTLSGYSCSNFSVKDDNDNDITDATLSGSVLTMPSKAVTVSSVLSSTHEAVAVSYIDKDGIEQTAQAIALDGAETSLEAGTYFVGTNITYDHTLTLDGDITLILCDGKTMTIGTSNNRVDGWGIKGFEGDDPDDANKYHNLEIYGQSAGSGALSVYTNNKAGIVTDLITINGGNVSATGSTGISSLDNDITLGGGIVTASSYVDTVTIADGWTYTDGTEASYTGAISSPVDGATYQPEWTGSGDSENTPCLIKTTADLDLLAKRVNNGLSDFSGKYFQLANDITYAHTTTWNDAASTENNYTAIGYNDGSNDMYFSGHFDGANHVISGIRIYKDGTGGANGYQGLFGWIKNDGDNKAEVKNVILADTRITGKCYVGGIAGLVDIINEENGGTVENCHVLSNVTVHAVGSNASDHGGIAGANWGTVTGCTSAAAVTTAEGISSSYYGGIVGDNNGPISDCIYLGSNLGGNYLVGAIAGVNDDDGNVSNCYFTSTTITGKNGNGDDLDNTNSAVGENYATVETNVGLAPQDTKDNSGFLTLMAARNAALTAVERTTPLSTAIDVTFNGRTLYKDGAWNTLCLPFSIDDINAKDASDNYICPLHGATVKTLVSSSFSGGTLSMNFTEDKDNLTAIQAGVPYIVKWTPVDGYVNDDAHNIVNPVFTDVIVSNTTANVSTDCVDFVGTYSPTDIYTADKTNLYLGGGNTLYYPWADGMEHYYVKANRAYFQLKNELTAGDPASGVRAFNLNFGDGEASGITTTNYTNLTNYSDAWYTVNGVKLDGKPTKAGLYINNGRKIVIK